VIRYAKEFFDQERPSNREADSLNRGSSDEASAREISAFAEEQSSATTSRAATEIWWCITVA
jgi:hypothetical protein